MTDSGTTTTRWNPDYEEAIAYIAGLSPTLERPTLARMKLFMKEQGDFQNSIPSFHVGGTNGKGSTATVLDGLLRGLGLKVGRFTGPHILRWNERMSFDGEPIEDSEFAEVTAIVREHSLAFGQRHPDMGPLTWFEFLTAMAFFYFQRRGVDCAVLEVGLGGRFDATNVAENVLGTIITNIDLDHTHILGDTQEQIAFEKAGIMKTGVPVMSAATDGALEELRRQALAKGTIVVSVDSEGRLCEDSKTDSNLTMPEEGIVETLLSHLSLIGPHQRVNAALALRALFASSLLLHLSEEAIEVNLGKSLERVYWPGRIQVFEDRRLVLDGAHNPAGALALREALNKLLNTRYCFVTGFFKNKNVEGFIDNLVTPEDRILTCQVDTRRKTYPVDEILEICRSRKIEACAMESVADALTYATETLREGEMIVATGSFTVLRDVMKELGWKTVEDGRPALSNVPVAGSQLKQTVTNQGC